LPTAVVNEILQEKIGEIEDREARKLSKKERTTLKDELIFELLPKAFRFSRKTYAYIDPKGGWLLVDSASAKSAEDLLSNLRKCLGSLPAIPLNTLDKPSVNMTQWLSTQQAPDDLTIEDECELRSLEEEGGIIRCKKHDLTVPEIKNHLDTGKQAIKLAVNWGGRMAFILDEHLALKRLRFLDMVQDQAADIDTGSAAERFDADFTIMALELAELLPRLTAWFGGENRT
jgi:recombination associated protein RdgC